MSVYPFSFPWQKSIILTSPAQSVADLFASCACSLSMPSSVSSLCQIASIS